MTNEEIKSLRPGNKVQVNTSKIGPGRVFVIGDIVPWYFEGWMTLTDEEFSFSIDCRADEVVKL